MRSENLAFRVMGSEAAWDMLADTLAKDDWEPMGVTAQQGSVSLEAWRKQPRGPLGRFRRAKVLVVATNWDD